MKLNNEQRKAVELIDGAVMVLAGPGTGKTAVIVHRLEAMLRAGIPAESILVITFTRAAAAEMKKRFLSMMRHDASMMRSENRITQHDASMNAAAVTFGTFHSVFFGILKSELALGPESLADDRVRRRILRDLMHEKKINVENEVLYLDNLLGNISLIKSEGGLAKAKETKVRVQTADMSEFTALYRGYADEMKSRRLVDFDDMILMTGRLLDSRPEVLDYWRKRYRYILIDEFQDISTVQYNVVKQLAPPETANIFVVGDDDQNIYGFRGARPEIMLGFPSDYPGTRTVQLRINYRSSEEIISAAANVISHNSQRYEKTIISAAAAKKNESVSYKALPAADERIPTDGEITQAGSGCGQPAVKSLAMPCVRSFDGVGQQNDFILHEIRRLHSVGLPYREMAALYRTASTYRPLLDLLAANGIPFAVDQIPQSVYTHWIADDLLSYLRIFAGSRARSDYLRIINRPVRWIKREAFDSETVDPGRIAKRYGKASGVYAMLEKLCMDIKKAADMSPYAAVSYLRRGIGYEDFIKEYAKDHRTDPDELLMKLDELHEIALSMKTHDEWIRHVTEKRAAAIRSDKSAIHSDNSAVICGGGTAGGNHDNADAVCISTMHRAKGLEYDAVFIPDANEGLIPYRLAQLPAEKEEERRLFYVAMTRAKRRLYVLHTRKRYNREMKPSEFIKEMSENSSTTTGK